MTLEPSTASDLVAVRVSLFGAFRELAHAAELWLAVPRGTTVSQLRGHLRDELARSPVHRDLVDASALAFDEGILRESDVLAQAGDQVCVAILPPVCGG
jgi:molybdopterin converting factor small subunit